MVGTPAPRYPALFGISRTVAELLNSTFGSINLVIYCLLLLFNWTDFLFFHQLTSLLYYAVWLKNDVAFNLTGLMIFTLTVKLVSIFCTCKIATCYHFVKSKPVIFLKYNFEVIFLVTVYSAMEWDGVLTCC